MKSLCRPANLYCKLGQPNIQFESYTYPPDTNQQIDNLHKFLEVLVFVDPWLLAIQMLNMYLDLLIRHYTRCSKKLYKFSIFAIHANKIRLLSCMFH